MLLRPPVPVEPLLMPGDVDDLKTDIAVLGNKMDNLSQDVKSVTMTMGGLITRAEITELRLAHKEVHNALNEEIRELKANQTWAVRALIAAWAAGAGLTLKIFGAH